MRTWLNSLTAILLVLQNRVLLGALVPQLHYPAHPMNLANTRFSNSIPIHSDTPQALLSAEHLPGTQIENNDDATFSESPLAIAPRNAAAVVGDTVQLVCEISPDPNYPRVVWVEFITKYYGEVITSDKEVFSDHPHAHRYSILPGSATQFNLQITQLELNDGGKYMCAETTQGINGSAELVIIETEPVCETTFSSSNGVVVVGQQHSITCRVDFRTFTIKPVMSWTVPWPGPVNVLNESGATYVRSTLTFTVTQDMDGTTASCKTGFVAFESSEPNTATNAPQWQHTYQSITLKLS